MKSKLQHLQIQLLNDWAGMRGASWNGLKAYGIII